MKRLKQWIILLVLFVIILGCAAKIPYTIVPDYANRGTKLIAVLPVKNQTPDAMAAQILRDMIITELYFNGYRKIPAKTIDEQLTLLYGKDLNFTRGNVEPQAIGDILKVDAVLYSTLIHFDTTYRIGYAPTQITIAFELRSVKTGETIWSARYDKVKRNFGISRESLQLKSYQVYEMAMQEAVDQAMKTIPNGPDA